MNRTVRTLQTLRFHYYCDWHQYLQFCFIFHAQHKQQWRWDISLNSSLHFYKLIMTRRERERELVVPGVIVVNDSWSWLGMTDKTPSWAFADFQSSAKWISKAQFNYSDDALLFKCSVWTGKGDDLFWIWPQTWFLRMPCWHFKTRHRAIIISPCMW